MDVLDKFSLLPLLDALNNKEIGDETVNGMISDFSCPINRDIEHFLKDKAVMYETHNISRTTLILCELNDSTALVGYFSITISPFDLTGLKSSTKKRLFKSTYNLRTVENALLIGQLSKNFSNDYNKLISGRELFDLVAYVINQIDRLVPTRITYIDCEDIDVLKAYYESLGFEFYTKSKHSEGKELLTYTIPTQSLIYTKNPTTN